MTHMIIDIHSHLNLDPLYEQKDSILQKMREMNIGTFTVGTDRETSQRAIDIADKNPDVCWATVGLHPCEIPTPEGWVGDFEQLYELATHPKVVAIGETGLDYFHDRSISTQEAQMKIFKKHIELSLKVNKPLMLHVRASKGTDDAYYDALAILACYTPHSNSLQKGEGIRANFHFFSGSKQCMLDIIAAGFTISVDGPITFSQDYDEMIQAAPLESIMVETDAPFAAPKPYRGKVCEPWMVGEVVKKIAELKNLDEEVVRAQILENTKKFFLV